MALLASLPTLWGRGRATGANFFETFMPFDVELSNWGRYIHLIRW